MKKRQEIRKYLVFAGMFLLFIGCMWWIFAPSEKDRQEKEKNAGFNTELPDPRGAGIEADKITAYEQADMRRRQEEKMRTLEDFSAMADGGRQAVVTEPLIELSPDTDYPSNGTSNRNGGSYRRSGSFSSSTAAYNDINATLGSFYETPKEDPEKEALKAEVEQLKQAAAIQQPEQITYEEQVALLEKSYELAARYTPGKDGARTESREETEPVSNSRKPKAVPVGQVATPVVSSLHQPISDSVLFARLEQSGNVGFHTAVGNSGKEYSRNTIRACVHGDQTVTSGQGVRLRLLEPMRVGRYTLPRNSIVTGEGRIQGERLGIEIIQVEHAESSSRWNSPCMTTTDRTESSFRVPWRRMRSGRWPPTWDRTSARASPSPTSRQRISCCPNSEEVPYRECRNTYHGKCVRRKYTSSPAIP